jgi:hypothetical protein
MNPVTSVFLSGGVVALGHVVQGKSIPMRVFVGTGILAVGLSALAEGNAKFASQFGLLVLVGAIFMYAIPLGNAVKGLK